MLATRLEKTSLGCVYVTKLDIQPIVAARIMCYLKRISLNILLEERIISDSLFLDINNYYASIVE